MNTSIINLSDATFSTSKTNAKGEIKTTVRGIAGVLLSGSKANRIEAAGMEIARYIQNGQFRPLAREISRVFGSHVSGAEKLLGLSMETGTVTADAGITNRQAWGRVFASLNQQDQAKPYKGEKRSMLDIVNKAALDYDNAALAAKTAKDANMVEVETREVDTLALAE